MQFGYFTLSDNHYDDNTRSANAFVADIIDEAVYAEEVGLHSARITDTLKKVEAAGFDEVILYFNVLLKPHPQSGTRWRAL
jgi:hypothetical protein